MADIGQSFSEMTQKALQLCLKHTGDLKDIELQKIREELLDIFEDVQVIYEMIRPSWGSIGNPPKRLEMFRENSNPDKMDIPSMDWMGYAPALSKREIVQIIEICKEFMELNKLDKMTLWDNTAGTGQHIYMIGVFCEMLIPGKVTVRASDAHMSTTAPNPKRGKPLFPINVEKMTVADSLLQAGPDVMFFTAWPVINFHFRGEFEKKDDPGLQLAEYVREHNTPWVLIHEGGRGMSAGSNEMWDSLEGVGDDEEEELPAVYDRMMDFKADGLCPMITVYWDNEKPSTS